MRVLLLIPPGLSLLIASPMALSLLDADSTSFLHYMMALPFYLGLLCAPGYAFAALSRPRSAQLRREQRWWIRLSLLFGVLCSLAGLVEGVFMIFAIPPCLLSLAFAVYLRWDFERVA